MRVLLIETATAVCSVAMAEEGRVVARRECDEPNAHSTRLPLYVKEMLELGRPDAVGVSAGPGSYTGLRIGVSTAKGLCYGLDIPLVSVPTLLGMASLYYQQYPDYQGLVCPMIDARRMECYTMLVGLEEQKADSRRSQVLPATHYPLATLRDTQADVIVPGIYDEWLGRGEVVFIGDGAAKTREVLSVHPNARYDSAFRIGAEGLLPIVAQKLNRGQVEDVAYFEPFYLKDFVAKKSVVHGLR